VLSDDELRAIWKATEVGVFGAYVRFLLLTGARRNEAVEMKWTEIAGGDWTLPASRNKTGVELVRPLSGAALVIIELLRVRAVRLQMVWDNLRSAVFGMEALAHFGFEIRRLSTDVAIVAV
jgi:integrase